MSNHFFPSTISSTITDLPEYIWTVSSHSMYQNKGMKIKKKFLCHFTTKIYKPCKCLSKHSNTIQSNIMHSFGYGNTPCWIQIRIYQLDIFVLGTKTRVLNNTVGIAMSVCMAITNLRLALSGIFGIKLFHKKRIYLEK